MRIIVFTDPHRGFSSKTSLLQDKVFASLDQNSFDLVVVCGDWGTSKLDHTRGSFRAFRKAFPTKPILGVLGNHDLWDKKIKSVPAKFRELEKFAKESNIHLLENNPYETDDVIFMGFDGWYHYPHGDTNDHEFMYNMVDGKSVDDYLKDKADRAVNFMIDYPKNNKSVVSVTHFPCIESAMDVAHWNGNPRHGEVLLEFSDLILFGHTHAPFNEEIDGTRVINVGSGYQRGPLNQVYEILIYQIIKV